MKSVIVLLALVALAYSALDPNCLTAGVGDNCAECNPNWDQFGGHCVPDSCRINLGGLNMGLFDCVFWSNVDGSGTTTYTGTVNITGFNAVQTWPAASTKCFGFSVVLNSTQNPSGQPQIDHTAGVTASWDGTKTVYEWTFPHSEVISNCAEQTIGNKINYTCTWSHQITFQGFDQTDYTFLTNIVIDTGVNNVIDLTVTSLSKTNTCCTVYTFVTSKLDFIPAMGGAIDNTLITYPKNSHWYNRVSITDASYAVYYLNHVKATLGGAGFFYTLAPQTWDNSNQGHIDYDFLATMATNAVVTLNITNTVVLSPTAHARMLAGELATQSSGTMNIQGSNNAFLTSFAAMLLVVLAIFAF